MNKILIVDDDPTIRNVVRGYLEQNGFQVFAAGDGNAAMHMLRRESPDLLVLDLMLPDKDGWEMTRIIRKRPTTSCLTNHHVDSADR